MKLDILGEAQHRYDQEDAWWRENRDEMHLFVVEFEQLLELLLRNPLVGPVVRLVRGQEVRLRILPKTRHQVYYVYKEDIDTLEIWTIWHGRLGKSPRLK